MIAQYQQFVEGVRSRAGLDSDERARHVAESVLSVAGGHLSRDERSALDAELPSAIADSLRYHVPVQPAGDESELVREVGDEAGVPAERARSLVQAVLSEIAAEDEELGARLRDGLPSGSEALFTAPGGGPPPEWSAAGAGDRPRPLDDEELRRALRELVDWSGTTAGISREVRLPQERFRPLLNRIKDAEDALSHHVSIEERPGSAVFTARTRSLEAVTELDLRLARLIDDAVRDVGSGG